MRTLFALAAVVGCSLPTARADELSPETLAALKRATVFIKVESQGLACSGSGFLLSARRGQALVATNHHVVVPPVDGVNRPVRGRVDADVMVVFDSGTQNEMSVRGDVVALDAVHDLAILSVRDLPDRAVALDYQTAPKLYETMPVYSLGYPFGGALSTSGGGPAVTVGKAAISSVRTGEDGEVRIIQIDGALNPGNSGGPIVDSKGRLVGVAVATIKNSSGIGFAIPRVEVVRALDGRIGPCLLTPARSEDGGSLVQVDVLLVDPLHRVSEATLYYLPPEKLRGRSEGGDFLGSHPDCRKVSLRLDRGGMATALVRGEGGGPPTWFVQVEYSNGTGKTLRTPVTLAGPAPEQAPRVASARPPGRRDSGEAPPHRQGPDTPARPGTVSREPKGPQEETDIVGSESDPTFRDVSPRGGLLVGFQVGLGRVQNRDTVVSLRPLYLTPSGQRSGRLWGTDDSRPVSVRAKRGYAVGGITVRGGFGVEGFKVTFMRMKKEGYLDVNDSYESEWVGTGSGDGGHRLAGDGSLVLGVCGRKNDRDCTGIGLVLSTKSRGRADGGDR